MKRALQSIRFALVATSAACSGLSAQTACAATVLVEYRAPPAIPLAGRVTDAAHILSAAERSALTIKSERLERATQHQMVVVTIPSLGGRDIADFARDLGNSWGIGRKGYDDGVILLVAPHERKVRIAVGYGLEKTLTSSVCQKIIDESILPRFRKGDLAGGIEAGTDALVKRLR